MPHRRKILIIEHDDFLREILGNLLHKENLYILNAFCIKKGMKEARGKNIDTIILGTSCPDYKGKNSLHYLRKEFGQNIDFFILNTTNKNIDFIPVDMQMKISELSIKDIIKKLS